MSPSALTANLTGNVSTHPSRATLPSTPANTGATPGHAAAPAEATDELPWRHSLAPGPTAPSHKMKSMHGETSDLPRSVCCCCRQRLVLHEPVCKPSVPHRRSLTHDVKPGVKHHSSGDLRKGGIYSRLQPDTDLTEEKTEKHAEVKGICLKIHL